MGKRPLTLDDLYRLREASDPQIPPDDAKIAFVVTTADREADANRSSVWLVDTAGSEPRRLTHGESDAHPRLAPDGSHLAFLRATDGGPRQIWLLPSAGGEARKLTDLSMGASGFVWAPDCSRLAVVAPADIEGEPETDEEKERRRNAPVVIRTGAFKADGSGLHRSRRMHLFVVDAQTGEATQVTKNDVNVATPRWSADGRRIAFAASTSDRDVSGRTRLYVVAPEGGEPEEIAHWEGTAAAPVFALDDRGIVFVGQTRPGVAHSRLFTVSADGGEPTEVLDGFDRNVMIGAPAYPGALPRFTSDGRLLFCARDRGCTHAYVAEGRKARKVFGGSDRVVGGLSLGSETIAYVVSAPGIPSDVFVSATDGSDERRLTDLNAELLDEVALHPREERTFTAPDGTEIHGWVVRGDGPTPQPLLVDIHGGPHNAWNATFDAVHLYHEVLASQGWSLLLINPRGSDGYGEDFYRAVVGNWGEADEDDFLSAIDALVDEGLADPRRVAVCGYSYGGHMTNWLTARHGGRFAAAMSGGCVSDLQSYYGEADVGYWLGAFEVGAELYEARERYAELSPLSYVEGVTAPTLVLHGEDDLRCPVGQAEEWFVALRRRGVEVEFVRYPGASHLFILSGRPSHRIDYNRRIAEWMTRHVSREDR